MKNRRQKAEGSMRYINLEISDGEFPIQLTAYCLVPTALCLLLSAYCLLRSFL